MLSLRKLWLGVLLVSAMGTSCANAQPAGLIADLAARLPESGMVTLALMNGEVRDGYAIYGWNRSDDVVAIYDRTMMPSARIYETVEARVDARNFRPLSTAVNYYQDLAHLSVRLSFDGNLLSSERIVSHPSNGTTTQSNETRISEDLHLRYITFILPTIIPQNPGARYEYEWVAPLSGQIEQVTLAVVHGGAHELPDGSSIDSIRLEVRGAAVENDIIVSREADPRILEVDVIGSPISLVAIAE